VQTRKVTSFPIVLIGTEYWGGLFDWLRGAVLEAGTVSARDVDLLHLTDDVAEAVRIVTEADEEVAARRPE
jgi:predicted Rossmann-fold nucleotide-binding protein